MTWPCDEPLLGNGGHRWGAGSASRPAAGRTASGARSARGEGRSAAAEPAAAKPVVIPRSYALVVGIGGYKNLPEKQQLRYAERDAEAIYSILISPEGGNFRAENVHQLVGARATPGDLKRDSKSGCRRSPRPTTAC